MISTYELQQVYDNTVATLWGSATREMSWVHLDPKHGRVSVANARATGFWVSDYHGTPNMEAIADQARWAWEQIRAGADLEDVATHELRKPQMQIIVPKDQP